MSVLEAFLRKRFVVHGLGGVGKSRLTLEYALTYEAEYSALLMVTHNERIAERLHRVVRIDDGRIVP